MCITESLCCTAEINIVNQLYLNLKTKQNKIKITSSFSSSLKRSRSITGL